MRMAFGHPVRLCMVIALYTLSQEVLGLLRTLKYPKITQTETPLVFLSVNSNRSKTPHVMAS